MRIFLLVIPFFVFSCNSQNNNSKKLDSAWLDSIIKVSDSSYSKPYYRSDFVTAYYYVNKKDSSLCQVMKDSASNIRQVIVIKKDVRTFFGQYYSNGHIQANPSLDEFGQFHGAGIFYFVNGSVQSQGTFTHGNKTGEWKTFDEKGKLIATDRYDMNGQLIPHEHH
jgi:hypothetical protein